MVRAANESGKTTLLTALQWGLFGDKALPDRGKNFRHSPLDASRGERKSVTVSVEIDCEIPSRTGASDYRLIRSVTETVNGGDWKKSHTDVRLFQLKQTGADPIPNPDSHIRSYMPEELREVFFTDGDRTLSFIEGARGDQTKRVEGAIRSLLGLGIMEKAHGDVHEVELGLNRKLKER